MEGQNRKVKNAEILAKTPLRKAAVEIVEAALQSIDTGQSIRKRVRYENNILSIDEKKYNLENINRVFVVGVGKCSLEAAVALEDVLGERLEDGIVIDLSCPIQPRKIKFCKGDHPLPSENNVNHTKQLIQFLEKCDENDFILFVISGGGSALLCQPNNFNCLEEKDLMSYLMKSGANIREVNTVRKHLSLARGGYLAKYAFPAKSVSLIFSDVGEDMQYVASGPTVRDSSTVEEAKKIIEKYNAQDIFNLNNLSETPKEEKYFEKVDNILFLSIMTALNAIKNKAEEEGFEAQIVTKDLEGEARDVGKELAEKINGEKQRKVLIYGGETTVTVKKPGKGGRNQELVLGALQYLGDDSLIVAINSDGWDNTNFAGALGDKLTIQKASEKNLDIAKFLEDNQSYLFFEQTGDYFETGLTGSNVADLILIIKSNG